MKKVLYSQVAGRREGETPKWELSPFKVVIAVFTVVLAAWMAWVSLGAIDGTVAKEHVPVLHQRISKDRDHSDKKRDEAVDKITNKLDHQYEKVMDKLLEIQREG